MRTVRFHVIFAVNMLILVTVALLMGVAQGCEGGDRQAQGAAVPTSTASSIAPFSHVFVIVMENRSYDEIIGSGNAPYINQLAHTYALATRYYAIRHPSLPNYLALASGSTQGLTSDCPDCSFDAPNLVDQLEEHKKSWKAYEESMPSTCFNAPFSEEKDSLGYPIYARKHNPWMYFKSISGSPERCGKVVPLSQFDSDLREGSLPDYVWISPNLIHDMHDSSVQEGDNWLASFVPRILESPAWKDNGVLFVVWDEGKGDDGCCGNAAGGHIPALVLSPRVKPGFQSDIPYTHYSVLRTIEDAWLLGTLGEAGAPGTNAMADFFQ